MCSLNLVEIPKKCTSYIFSAIFEYCIKNHNMVVLGVYKRTFDETSVFNNKDENNVDQTNADGQSREGLLNNGQTANGASGQAGKESNNSGQSESSGASSASNKPYVWIHPPKNIELNIHDELFVLSDVGS